MMVKIEQLATRSIRNCTRGQDVCQILAAAINGADAGEAVRRHVSRSDDMLMIDKHQVALESCRRILVFAIGKASLPMAESMADLLKDRIMMGLVITKDEYAGDVNLTHAPGIHILKAGHPIPDGRNIAAGKALRAMAQNCLPEDLVIFLISGGGSALLMSPADGLSLEDIQSLTDILLKCGATITEINTIRKHIDDFKGGGMTKIFAPARVVTLILSDVLDDRIDMIASGPTVADLTTYAEAWEILKKYQVLELIPARIKSHLLSGMEGKIAETLKPGDPLLENVTNVIVGNLLDAIHAGDDAARRMGFTTRILTTRLQGEAAQVGSNLVEDALGIFTSPGNMARPVCLIAGGETTVTLKGDGLGGRNQELALGAVKCLAGSIPIVMVTLATDGGDGMTDAAGAVATNETYAYGLSLGLDPLDFLQRNDSYHYFEQMDDLIRTGPTRTNVNDLIFIFNF